MANGSMADKNPTKTEILGTVQAQAETLKELSERLVKIEGQTEKQESRNQNIIYAVLFALAFIVVTVSVEVILSSKSDNSVANDFSERLFNIQENTNNKMNGLQGTINGIQSEILLLRAKNSYLK